jgi:hypothetical protein
MSSLTWGVSIVLVIIVIYVVHLAFGPKPRPVWAGCSMTSQCAPGLQCRKSDSTAGGRCLDEKTCLWAASHDGTTPVNNCAGI